MYIGTVGPGMLETTRLNARGLAISRDRACCTVTGVREAAFSTRSEPSGSPSRLQRLMLACTW